MEELNEKSYRSRSPLAAGGITAQRESNFTSEHRMLSEAIAINGKLIDELIQKIGPILSPEPPPAEGPDKNPDMEQALAPLAGAIRELRKAVARTNNQLRAATSRVEL